ncbi:MAG: hypothetical protein J6M30_01005 [Bacteroidales bacterium]|nr:hypothetical protein [Bacteroidales bacterium]
MKKGKIFLILMLSVCVSALAQTGVLTSYCRTDTVKIIKDTADWSLIVYRPVNCSLVLSAKRADSSDCNVVFAAPAAFTAKNYTDIVGGFVGIDTVIKNPTEQETGLCTLDGSDVYIGGIEDTSVYFPLALNSGTMCYFQQMLLIHSSEKVPCTIFGKQKPTFRRALAAKYGKVCVIESLGRMDIDSFTEAMLILGITDAIYMDMGTWSEGFFVDINNQKTIIGQLKQNTRFQTNWLWFVKDGKQ